jgi:hypothetical protein
MIACLKFACLTILALWLGGCAQPKAVEEPPPFVVPSTAMVQTRSHRIDPYQVLVRADEADFWVGRGEKAVFGEQLLTGSSAFTTYTYDTQAISTPGGFGLRYSWVVQEGVSVPVNP